MLNHKYHISAETAGQRLDKFLTGKKKKKTRSYFTRHIHSGHVLVNGNAEKPGYTLRENDTVLVTIPDVVRTVVAADIPLDIRYEDEAILVVNKPAGLTVHPGNGTENDTLVNGLLHYTDQLAFIGQSDRPGIVHRLDKNTSGLMVIAKTDAAHRFIQQQFDTRDIHRTYTALVWGIPKTESGTVHTFINRSRKDPTKMKVTHSTGKEAITHWRLLEEFHFFSLLELRLDTGRTHQIRVHMSSRHHPLVGDPEYNGREKQLMRLPDNLRKRGHHLLKNLKRQFLHASKLEFIHPLKKEAVSFESELPADLQSTYDNLREWFLLKQTETGATDSLS